MGFRTKIATALIFGSLTVYGQKLDLSSLDPLAAKARKVENVTLDGDKLKLASQFLSRSKADERGARDVIEKLTGVFVRTFEFETPASSGYPELEPVRKQLSAPGWSKIVDIQDKDQNEETQVYIFSKDGSMGGLAVISAEQGELTVVNVAGSIGFEELKQLKGSLGIPGIEAPLKPSTKKKEKPKDD